jgi:hypothetical protein
MRGYLEEISFKLKVDSKLYKNETRHLKDSFSVATVDGKVCHEMGLTFRASNDCHQLYEGEF